MNVPSTSAMSLLAEFCEEANDLLDGLAEKVSAFVESPSDSDAIHHVFRAVHTIKGNAGFFGLPTLKSFAHSLEDALDAMRQGTVEVTEELGRMLIEGIDFLTEMVDRVENAGTDVTLEDAHTGLLDRLAKAVEANRDGSIEALLLDSLQALAEEISGAGLPEADSWAQRLLRLAEAVSQENRSKDADVEDEPEASVPRVSDLESASFRCGDEDVTELVKQALGPFAASERKECPREQGEAFLEATTQLAEKARQMSREDLAKRILKAHDDFATVYNSPLDLDELLLSVVWDELGPALQQLRVKDSDSGEADARQPVPANSATSSRSGEGGRKPGGKARILRVQEERIDAFLEDVSNLFITIERLKELQQRMSERLKIHDLVDELRQINTTLSAQSTALQTSVVDLRKVEVRELFSKFPRVARSLASSLGKQIEVHLEGKEVEVDKSLVEDLDGPLMHMVRNVCDHGIETPQEREARGVSPTGNLWLKCSLTKSHVVITVQDDGRGIDPQRLREKAVSSGWLAPEAAAALSDQEAIELIFHPGMSTAEKITDISGRGVGLDVVRTRLREHNGDVKVRSKLGEGTTFLLEIPIRKAVVVIDGLLVTEGDSTFVVPFEFIREIVRVTPDDLTMVGNRPVVRLRGEPFAAWSLAELLDMRNAQPPTGEGSSCGEVDGVLLRHKKETIFLAVGSIAGQRKVVVSDLSGTLPYCARISGVAQLGAGKLALVINSAEIINCATGRVPPSR